MTVEEYLEAVSLGFLTDHDGMGDVARDGLYATADLGEDGWPKWVYPSQGVEAIPEDATHIR